MINKHGRNCCPLIPCQCFYPWGIIFNKFHIERNRVGNLIFFDVIQYKSCFFYSFFRRNCLRIKIDSDIQTCLCRLFHILMKILIKLQCSRFVTTGSETNHNKFNPIFFQSLKINFLLVAWNIHSKKRNLLTIWIIFQSSVIWYQIREIISVLFPIWIDLYPFLWSIRILNQKMLPVILAFLGCCLFLVCRCLFLVCRFLFCRRIHIPYIKLICRYLTKSRLITAFCLFHALFNRADSLHIIFSGRLLINSQYDSQYCNNKEGNP